jgi:hypothetical protein
VQLREDDALCERGSVQRGRNDSGVALIHGHGQLGVFAARLVPVCPDEGGQPIEVAEVLGGERNHRWDTTEEPVGWALVQQRAVVDDDEPVRDVLVLTEDV